MDVFDKQGNPIQIDPANVRDAFLQGQVQFKSGDMIPVLDPDGRPAMVKAEDAPVAFRAGAQYAPEEVKKAQLQEQYGGVGQTILGGAEALASGATFGASRALERGLGVSPEAMRGREEASPVVTGLGEVAGAIAPSLLTSGAGGASAIGKITAKYPWLIPTAKVSEGAAALTRELGGGLTARVAGGATEGAFYGAGSAISQASTDPELDAEHLMASVGKNIGFGALLGGGLELGGHLIGKGLSYGLEKLPKPESLTPEALDQFAASQTSKAIIGGPGPRIKWEKKVDKYFGGPEEIGKTWDEMGLAKPGMGHKENLARAEQVVEDSGQKLNQVYKNLDAAGQMPEIQDALPDTQKYFDEIKRDFIAPMKREIDTKSVAEKLEGQLDEMQAIYAPGDKISFADNWRMTQGVGRLANWENVAEKPYNKAVTKLYQEMRSKLQNTADDIAEKVESAVGPSDILGPELAQAGSAKEAIQGLNRQYSTAKLAADISKDKVAGEAANRTFSLTDHIAGATGMMGGLAHGSPIGVIAGLAMAPLNKLAREHGTQMIAASARAFAKAQRQANVSAQAIVDGIKTFIRGGSRAAIMPILEGVDNKKNFNEQYDERQKALNEVMSSPHKIMNSLERAHAPVSQIMPEVAQAMQIKTMQIADFLNNAIPKNPSDISGPTILTQEWEPSREQKYAWNELYNTATHPLGIIDDLNNGTLTKQSVDTILQLYPRIFDQIRQEAAKQIIDHQANDGKPLSLDKKRSLSLLLGTPVDHIVSPDLTVFIQQQYGGMGAQETQQQSPSPAPMGGAVASGRAGNLNFSESRETDTQSINRRRNS